MTTQEERKIYQHISIGLFMLFIALGWKYQKLSEFTAQQSKDKIYYCQEYHKAMCSIESFLEVDTTMSIINNSIIKK
tara:strand:+ start:161 stop:391 length:231 start_codon:yes stop_codon:yes gene_type:complete